MMRTTMVIRLMRCALVPIILGSGATLCLAQGSTRADVADMINKHDEALKQQNLEGLMALYSSNPKTVMLGTGPGEKFQGKEEIKAAYGEIFKDFDKGTMTSNCYWKNGGGTTTTVWGAAMCKFTDSKGGKNREYEMNVSAVAEKQGGEWQFVLIHFSNLVGSGGTTK